MGLDGEAEQGQGADLERGGRGDLVEDRGRWRLRRSNPASGERLQLAQQGPEAVHRATVLQALGARLAEGLGRTLSERHRVSGQRWLIVLEQQRRPGLLQMPLHVVSEHAEEDVGTNTVLGPVADWTHL